MNIQLPPQEGARGKAAVRPAGHKLRVAAAGSWAGVAEPQQPEKPFRVLLGSRRHIEATVNSACPIFSNRWLFAAIFCVVWKLQVLGVLEIMYKQAKPDPTEDKKPLGSVQAGFHPECLH